MGIWFPASKQFVGGVWVVPDPVDSTEQVLNIKFNGWYAQRPMRGRYTCRANVGKDSEKSPDFLIYEVRDQRFRKKEEK